MSKWDIAELWYIYVIQSEHKIVLTHATIGDNLAAYTRNRSHQKLSVYTHVYGSNTRYLRRTRPPEYFQQKYTYSRIKLSQRVHHNFKYNLCLSLSK